MSLIKVKNFATYAKRRFTNDNRKVRDHCHFTGKYRVSAHNKCNMNYKISKNIPIVFHNGSRYDYHFIIKELAKEIEGQFECLGKNTERYITRKNTERYITFSVPINKEIIEIDKDNNDKL